MTTCRECSRQWRSYVEAHCGGCHQHFTGVSSFDLHLRGGSCLLPADVGLVVASRSDGNVWAWPGERDAAVFGSGTRRDDME